MKRKRDALMQLSL